MVDYDVFNGDADGICALQQLRLAEPRDGVLVTGVKRDIGLLARVPARGGDRVTVLDISLDKNRSALTEILARGAEVFYVDHHYAGEIPSHPGLETSIDTAPDIGTSLLVDAHLSGRFRAWAVVGTFGDNLDDSARRAARPLGLAEEEIDILRRLGICLNYNGYGASVDDLHFSPDDLYKRISCYPDPLVFVAEDDTLARLESGYKDDMAKAGAVEPELLAERVALYLMPAEPWARRVSGAWGNALAQKFPARAHALLTRRGKGGFVVSVRAPLERKEGADTLCRQFDTGGGRQAAAGINDLPDGDLERFVDAFRAAYG